MMRNPEPRKKKKTAAPKKKPSPQIAELQARLEEAEETLEAIRSGAVDAIVVAGTAGDQVYTLNSADQSYRLLLESVKEGVVTISSGGVILYCNQQFAGMVGLPLEKIIGIPFLNFVSKEDHCLFREVFSSRLQSICRYRIFLRGRRAKDLFVQVSLGFTDVAGTGLTTAIVSDLTEQLRHQEMIKEERLSRAIIDQAPIGIAVCDKSERIIRMSPALKALYPENIQGKKFDEYFNMLVAGPREKAKLFSTKSLLDGKIVEKAEGILYGDDGRISHVILNGRPLFNDDHEIVGCLIALLDITDRKHAEHELQTAHHQLEMATLAAGAGTWEWNIKTGYAQWSDDTFRLYGLDAAKDKPSVEKWMSVLHPEDAKEARQRLKSALDHQEPYVSDYRIMSPDGQVRWITSRGKALYDENGSPERITGICIDNTRQKLSEARIIMQNALLDGINHIFQESVACPTEQELSAACLDVALDLTESKFGFIGEVGMDGLIYDLTARDSEGESDGQRQDNKQCPGGDMGLCEKVIRDNKGFFINESGMPAMRIRISGGQPPLAAFLAVPLVLDDRAIGILAVCNREAGYTAVEQDLLEDLAPSVLQAILAKRAAIIINHQANLLSMVNDAVIAFDRDRKITYWNTAAARMYGWTTEEVLGKTVEKLMSPLTAAETIARRDACMKLGEIFRDEFIHRRKDGSTFWVEESSCALFDDDRKIYGYIAANRNISNRKKEEEEKKDWMARLEAANRELESFSYSVSHDLRAPLRAIDGYSRMILRKHGANFDPDAVNKFNEIRLNTQKMGQLIDDLLSFSRMGRVEMTVTMLDMEGLIEDVWRATIQQAPERKMTFKLVKPVPKGLGDLAMIRQVLSNLLDNAVKFTAWKEEASIEVGGYAQGAENIYYVKDNGAGFDMQYYDKLFGVFQRLHTAEDFAGTGVGLAIVRRILKRQSGRVWAEGEADKGACFYFSLPSVTF